MKTTNRKDLKQTGSYKAGILKRTGIVATKGGQAYLRPEYHDRISEIIALFGDNGMTVEDYLDNVLTEHFTQCQDATDASTNREAACHRHHDVRRIKRQTADRPVKGYIREVSSADAEKRLATFLEASEIKTRQCIYIDRETHGRIAGITKYLGNGLSIGKYVDIKPFEL